MTNIFVPFEDHEELEGFTEILSGYQDYWRKSRVTRKEGTEGVIVSVTPRSLCKMLLVIGDNSPSDYIEVNGKKVYIDSDEYDKLLVP